MNDYTKGILTGASLILCFFMLVSAKSQSKNLGDIVVNSVTVHNDRGEASVWIGLSPTGDGYLQTYNADGKKTSYLGTGGGRGGHLSTYNVNGTMTTYLGTSEGGGGHLNTWNTYGKETAYLGTGDGDGGNLATYNKYEKLVGYFGTGDNGENIIQDGMAMLFDRYGDLGWSALGKK